MTCKSSLRHAPDEPFSRVILIPSDRITVIHRELMVEVVVSFANSDQSSDKMILWSMLIIEGGLTEPVSKGVDAESGLIENG